MIDTRVGTGNSAALVPGDGLLHPAALGAIALLIVNDHVLKQIAPGLVTGKLSDFAGLLFFPLLIQAGFEVARSALRNTWAPSNAVLLVSVLITAIGFTLVKIEPVAASAFAIGLGTAQWLVGQILLIGPALPGKVQIASDPTDLVALPVLLLTYLIGRSRIAGHLVTDRDEAPLS